MRNFGAKLLGEAGVRVCSFLFIFILARRLGPAQSGLYSAGLAYATLFTIFGELSSNMIVTREIARHPAECVHIVRSAHFLRASMGVLGLLALHLCAPHSLIAEFSRTEVDALGVTVLCYAFIDFMGALVAGKDEMGWEAALRASSRVLSAVTGIVMLLIGRPLTEVILGVAAAAFASVLGGHGILVYRVGHFVPGFDPKTLKRIFMSSLPLLASFGFWILYDNQDVLLLKHFGIPDGEIGLFWSASKIIDVLRVIPVLLAGAFFPQMSKLSQDRDAFRGVVLSLLAAGAILIPAIIGPVFLSAPHIQRLLYGQAFVPAVPLLRILLAAYGATFLNQLFLLTLVALDRERQLIVATAFACVSNFALAWALIPKYGTRGVCYALVVSEFFCLAFQIMLAVYSLRPRITSTNP